MVVRCTPRQGRGGAGSLACGRITLTPRRLRPRWPQGSLRSPRGPEGPRASTLPLDPQWQSNRDASHTCAWRWPRGPRARWPGGPWAGLGRASRDLVRPPRTAPHAAGCVFVGTRPLSEQTGGTLSGTGPSGPAASAAAATAATRAAQRRRLFIVMASHTRRKATYYATDKIAGSLAALCHGSALPGLHRALHPCNKLPSPLRCE